MIDFHQISKSSLNSQKALQLIFGVGPATARTLLSRFGISGRILFNSLPISKLQLIKSFLERNLVLENRRRYIEEEAYRKLVANNSLRGIRLSKGLPVHGQRTKSNASTAKRLRLSLKYKS